MTTISSISELLSLSNCQYRVYDLGRKIEKLSKDSFNKFEQCQIPHAFPFQGHAQLAIAFWQKNSTQPYLWFVKLPLDERGLLNQGARDHFISIIVEALGTDLAVDPSENQEELLKSNPYIFTPSQYKLAMLNSLLSVELKRQPSKHYQNFVTYLHNKNWGQWQSVGVQGIADFASRLKLDSNSETLSSSLEHLPFEVLSPLCGALENCELPVAIIEDVLELLESNDDLSTKQMLIRSLSSSTSHPFVDKYFSQLLSQAEVQTELIITVAGRCWAALNDQERMMQFLELLVKQPEDDLFPAIFQDLVAIPVARPLLFQCMRAPNRSDKLAKAIGNLFKAN